MEQQIRKQVLRKLTYGLYVVTAMNESQAAGGTINWLSQASFQPPLIMLAVKKGSNLHKLLEQGAPLAVNILGADQKEVAEAFFRPSQREGNTINGYPFRVGVTGAPILDAVPAAFEALIVGSLPGGDHTIFVAEVVEAHLHRDAPPLEMWDTGWFYGG